MSNQKKQRFSKTQIPRDSSSRIKPTKLSPPSGISFSYKYFQLNHDRFSVVGRDSAYLMILLERLRDLSSWNSLDLKQNGSKSLRCHPIAWEDTCELSFGIPNEDQLIDKPYQFSLSSNEHGRVHGFFIEEIFYVVWLDPDHNLYQ